MEANHSKTRKWLITAAIPVGVALGAAGIAAAATNGSSTTSSSSTAANSGAAASNAPVAPNGAPQGAPHGAMDPAQMPNGPGETLLTGTNADKVKAAALAAVPGGTIIRVETDSEGSPYEAHVKKSDGSIVTVKVDANFAVSSTNTGFGRGPAGGPGGPGQVPAQRQGTGA